VRLRRCWLYVPAKVGALKRMLHEASFVTLSLLRALAARRPDVYVIISPPLLLGVAAWIVGLLKRAPFVFHVQDLQPDAAVGLGMLRRGWLTRALYGLEACAYAGAARVSGISGGMLEMFRRKGVPEKKLLYFPNGVELARELPSRGRFRARHGISDDAFLALYSGNLGVKQGLDVLVEAARLLGSRPNRVRIVIAGDGARRAHLEQMIGASGLRNVLLLPLQAEPEYREMLADADCCVITQQQGSGAFFFPSKLLAALAVAKPVVTVADEMSELARAAHDGGFGVNIAPEQPQALAAAIEELAGSGAGSRLAALGEAGLQFVQRFEMERVLSDFTAELATLAPASARDRRAVPHPVG